MRIFLMFATVCFFASSSWSLSSGRRLEATYSASAGEVPGDSVKIEWDFEARACKLLLPGSRKWLSLPFKRCEPIAKKIANNWPGVQSALQDHSDVSSRRMMNSHERIASIEMNGRKIALKRSRVEWCDEKGENCKLDSFDLIDELGEWIRNLVAERSR